MSVASRVVYERVGVGVRRVVVMTCPDCGNEWEREATVGRPPVRCPVCRVVRAEEMRARPRPMSRSRGPLRRKTMLGPVPCQECRGMVTWNGLEWQDVRGAHSCRTASPTRFGALGWERRCDSCAQWWPDDQEFYVYRSGELEDRSCRACRVAA
jgi:hypothetical protein